jgi:type IV pilus assembly protein PilC
VATTEDAAANKIQSLGILPTAITAVDRSGLNREITIPGFGKGVKLRELAIISRQMSTLISAGLPLVTVLSVTRQQVDSKVVAEALDGVRTQVEQGISLSQGFAQYSDVFPKLFVQLVADAYERQVKLHDEVKSAMTYPVVVLVIAVLAVIGITWFIVPIFQDMFEQLGGELPLPTQVLVSLSHVMPWLGPLVIVLSIAVVVAYRANKDNPRVRHVLDPMLLRMPVLGKLNQKVAVGRFMSNLAVLSRAGVSLTQALATVAGTAGNAVVEDAVLRISEAVSNGESLASAMRREPVFPNTAVQMVAAGEASGELDSMLTKVAAYYDEEVQSATDRLTAVMEPIMIVVIGVIIGGMVIALYLPMFQLNTMVGNS